MRRPIFLGALIYGLILAGLVLVQGPLLILALPVLLYLGLGLLLRPAKPRLKVTRRLSADRVPEGRQVVVRLKIANEGPPLARVCLEDVVPQLLEVEDGETQVLTALPRGETVEMEYTVTSRRGRHRFAEVRVTVQDALGLFQRQEVIPTRGEFVVHPEIIGLRRVAIRPRQTRVYAGPIPTRRGGPGVEFFGVRGYQQGDPLRWINWKASVRHGRALYTNEFEQEQVADVGLVLDVRQRADLWAEGESLFEHMVRATGALAEAFLGDGHRVGLLLYGRGLDWTFPGYGKIQRERVLQVLARAAPGDSMVFDRLDNVPARLFPARSQLVLVSPLFQDDLQALVRLRAREYSILVVSPDPISFEEKVLEDGEAVELGVRVARLERMLLLRRLRQAGIGVLEWQVDTPFERACRFALGRLPLWLRAV